MPQQLLWEHCNLLPIIRVRKAPSCLCPLLLRLPYRSLLALSPQDMVAAVYLTTGRIAPAYEPNGELHVGEATVAGALRDATGVGASRMRSLYRELGDLGDVAQACPRTQSTLVRVPPLTLDGLMASLKGMATDKGQGSAGRRQQVGREGGGRERGDLLCYGMIA